MKDDEPTDDDSSTGLMTTRRKVMAAAAAVAGSAALGGAATSDTTNASIGGGPMADPQAEHRIKHYKGTFAERPDPGVAGRIWEVDDPSDTDQHGAIYIDDGSSWDLADRRVQNLHSQSGTIGELSTEDAAITESLRIDQSEHNPHPIRSLGADAETLWNPKPSFVDNPILTASDVSIASSNGVADPFIRETDDGYAVFIEAIDSNDDGAIVRFTGSSLDSLSEDAVIINDRPTHHAYPLVQTRFGTTYLTPHNNTDDFKIYTSDSLTGAFSLTETNQLGGATDIQDPTPFYDPLTERWYVLVRTSAGEVRLYYADEGESLTGRTWSEHTDSPLATGVIGPCGTPKHQGDVISVPVQEQGPSPQNEQVVMYQLRNLSPNAGVTFSQTPSRAVLQEAQVGGWNTGRTHHLDILASGPNGQPVALADANSPWRIGVVAPTTEPLSAATVTLSSNQTITNGSYNDLDLTKAIGGERHDYDETNGYYVVPADGEYEVKLQVSWDGLATNGTAPFRFQARFWDYANSAKVTEVDQHFSLNDFGSFTTSFDVDLDAGEQIGVKAYQTSGDSLTLQSNFSNTRFSIRRTR